MMMNRAEKVITRTPELADRLKPFIEAGGRSESQFAGETGTSYDLVHLLLHPDYHRRRKISKNLFAGFVVTVTDDLELAFSFYQQAGVECWLREGSDGAPGEIITMV